MGVAAILLTFVPVFDIPFPAEGALRSQAIEATRIYAEGSYMEILDLRWREARQFSVPMLIYSLSKTFGLMLLGIAAWRLGILQRPAQHRGFLLSILIGTGIPGAVAATLLICDRSSTPRTAKKRSV